MKNFEENLKKLEELSLDIKRSDISLEDALKDFEEGIKLANGIEEELNKIEGKIQILMNEPVPLDKNNQPQFDSFDEVDSQNGSANAPLIGTRQ